MNINGKHYCAYCGKEIPEDITWDDHERYEYYHCDCDGALLELKIEDEINELRKQIKTLERSKPKTRFKIDNSPRLKKV